MTCNLLRRIGVSVGAVLTLGIATAGPALGAATPQANASAQGVSINLPGYTLTKSSPATAASNDGSGSADPVRGAPGILTNSAFVQSTGPMAEVAQAGVDGSSYACAGQGGILFKLSDTCQVTPGASTTIIRLDAIPAIGNALSGTACPQMRLNWNTVAVKAVDDGTNPPSATATLPHMTISPCTLLGQPANCRTLPLTPDLSPNTDLFAEILDQMAAVPDCAEMVAALQGIQDQVEFVSNRQTTSSGVFRVDALHFASSGDSYGFDLATVTVGPNSIPTVETALISPTVVAWFGGVALLVGFLMLLLRRRAWGRRS